MASFTIKPLKESERNWFFFDAQDYVLGRLATKIADILRGKHKAVFSPQWDMGDFVVVVNCGKVQVTGDKKEKKIYYRHTGYPGGLKEEKLADLKKRRPTEILRRAVWGMLPKNKLRKPIIKKLYLFEKDKHLFSDKQFVNA